MQALVIYDSKFGNTEQIAQAIGDGLRPAYRVRVAPLAEAKPLLSANDTLLIVGGPTHQHGMSLELSALFDDLPRGSLAGCHAATFDTRYPMASLLSGSAAQAAARRLTQAGCQLIAPPESFFIARDTPPQGEKRRHELEQLAPGEISRAKAWAGRLVTAQQTASTRPPHQSKQGTQQSQPRTKGDPNARPRFWRWLALSLVGIVVVGASATYLAYASDLQKTRNQLAAGSQIVATRHGPLEYTTWGDGPAVLVIHGAGGGYDQGTLIAQAYGGAGFRWIVPSRFGYLRTPLPKDASTLAQAEAFADLLDTLKVARVAILAMSGGVPPALQFAQRYPERTAALVLLSAAPYTPLTAATQKLPVPAWVYQALFSSDFPYWLLQKVARTSLEPIFDVTPTLRAGLSAQEARMVAQIVDSFQPVTGRVAGLGNEGAAIDPKADYRLAIIHTPALVVHSIDDHINPFSIGQYTAAQLQHAQLLALPTGGHLLLGHQAEVQTKVNAFLRQYTQSTTESQP